MTPSTLSFATSKVFQLLPAHKQTFNQEQLDEIMLVMDKKTWGFLMCGLSILNILSSPSLGTAAIQRNTEQLSTVKTHLQKS